jgi:uncharacterized protein YkwD
MLDGRALMAGGMTTSLSQGVLMVVGTSASTPIVVNVLASSTPQGPSGYVVAGGVDSYGVYAASGVRVVAITAAPNEWIAVVPGQGWNPQFQVSRAAPQTTPAGGLWAETTAEQAIVNAVNTVRQMNGLAPLTVNTKLVEAARIHASDMARLDQMAHTLPGAALPTLEDRANYVGYNYSILGENIAYGYSDTGSVMNAWMNSPGHRANILSAGYQEIGIGIAYDASGVPYYCQVFGTQMK